MSREYRLFNPKAIEKIREAKKKWRKEVYEYCGERGERWKTLSGIPVEPLYAPDDITDIDYLKDLGFPGMEPYTRGVYPTMYRGHLWTMRQLAGFGSPEKTNIRYKFLLKEGAMGLNCTFDYPTLRGYDSTDPEAQADAGRGGVAIDTIEDVGILFQDIPIDKLSVSLVTCQPICNISVQSMYFANAQLKGIPLDDLAGTSQNDFMMETAITTAPSCLPPEASFKLSCDAIEYCTFHTRRWNPISIAGYNYREAGCTAIQEIAFVLENAIACTEELIRRGLPVDRFAPRLSFFLSAHSDFFEEIAKCRAARRIWCNIMKKRFKAENPRSCTFRFHVQTAGVALTAQQPLNNITRAAYHALSAVLGGAQSVHVDAYDEALCTPTELSSLTALRTQQILQNEIHVTHTIDPLSGSYFVESLTHEMENRILSLMDKIEAMGGIVKAVSSGWIHSTIAHSSYEEQKAIESGVKRIVGVNCYELEDEVPSYELFEVPETVEFQKKKINRIRKERSTPKVQKVLESISRACEKGDNLMEVCIEAVKYKITLGEISAILKEQFGIWNPSLF